MQRFWSLLFTVSSPAFFRCAFLTFFIVLSACHSTPQNTQPLASADTSRAILPASEPLTPAEAQRLHAACEGWYDTMLKGFNGGIAVAKKGNIVFEAYNGSPKPGGPDPVTDTTSFHIASVSKTFTAMAVLKLWQDGKLNIDDEYSKYFPAFDYPGVTLRSMLSHRSGLPNYIHFMENMGWNQKQNITNQDVLDFMIAHKKEIPNTGLPNRGFAYCNTNFALLALLIEKVSGMKYGDYLKQTFFIPLGMNHSFVYDNARDSGKVTMSYEWRGRVIPMNFLDRVYGDKNVYSTPRDLLAWDRGLTSGKLFTDSTLAQAYTPYSNEKPSVKNYGLGWRMNIYPSGKKMIYHNGWWHGNNAAFIRLLEDSATIVVLGNKYDREIYRAKDLSNLFGNYFNDGTEDEVEGTQHEQPVRHRRASPHRGRAAKTTATHRSRAGKPVPESGAKLPSKKKRHTR